MCRMVGVVSRGAFPSEVLMDLRRVSEVGKVPGWKRLGHRDGWGVAAFNNGSPYYLARKPVWAARDDTFAEVVKRASSLSPPGFLVAHVRAASRGSATTANTHPFIADNLIFAHNGTIRGFLPRSVRTPVGETDSERLALAVAERYDSTQELRTALKAVIREEVLPRKFTGAVLIATDGKVLCGYRDYSENEAYYDLKISVGSENVVLFQETDGWSGDEVSQIRRREMVTIDPELRIERELIR